MDGILSIQSSVAYGHVGNRAAMFPLQRLGFEVWGVDTVQFSNHPGYGAWRGVVHDVAQLAAVLDGVAERGVFARTAAVLSGYLGDAALGELVLATVGRVRAERPDALFACDPVMGDVDRGFFVRPGIPELFRDRALPLADLVTPNAFEAAWLADLPIGSVAEADAAARRIHALGPAAVVVSSVAEHGAEDRLAVLAHEAGASWVVRTPRLPVALNGTGDALTALLLGNRLLGHDPVAALERSVAAMFALVEATWRAGSREVLLIACQDEYPNPSRHFPAERVS